MDICLVNMPLVAIQRPSLGLGLLSAILKRAGFSVRTLYPNVWYAEYAGLDFYQSFESVQSEDVFGEWLFAPGAFPDHKTDSEEYLQRIYARNRFLRERHPDLQDFVAATLKQRARAVGFLDWVAREVLASKPLVVGCTSVFQQHVASLGLLRRISEMAPDVITMLGGANCESEMGWITHQHFPWVDIVVSGEADGFIVQLVEALVAHGRDLNPELVPTGVFTPWHRQHGYPKVLPRASSYAFEHLPPPDYDDFFQETKTSLYSARIVPTLVYETSRGCWWGERMHCTFCGLNGDSMAYRRKAPEKVVEEIAHLISRYGIRRLEAADNILDMKAFDNLLPRLQAANLDCQLFFETKSNLNATQVQGLKRAGVCWIQPGIESLHTEVLRLMRKGVEAWRNIELLKNCRQHGLALTWAILFGFPGEKDEWYEEMARLLPLLAHLQPGRAFGLRIDRFSPYFQSPSDFGITIKPAPLYGHVYPLPDAALNNLAYFFTRTDDSALEAQGRAGMVAGRPGLMATIDALKDWRSAYPHAELVAEEQKGRIAVRDTRPCAVAAGHVLDPMLHTILQALDRATSMRRLNQTLAQSGHGEISPSSLEACVRELVERKLVLEIDDRYLSLVLQAPVTPMQANYSWVLGTVLPAPVFPKNDLRQLFA